MTVFAAFFLSFVELAAGELPVLPRTADRGEEAAVERGEMGGGREPRMDVGCVISSSAVH